MALQRYNASSSSSSSGSSSDASGCHASDDGSLEPPKKKTMPNTTEYLRCLSWNQLQSLELDDPCSLELVNQLVSSFHYLVGKKWFWFNCLLCFFSNLGKETSYQAHGKSSDRVRAALKKPCCKQKCKRSISIQLALRICIAFWSLTKSAQDSMSLCFLIYIFWCWCCCVAAAVAF